MARAVGGLGISHTLDGFEYDKGVAAGAFSPNWQPWYDGTRPVKAWLAALAPDQLVVVYNDHLNHFDFDAYPTLAAGVADSFPQADESWALRPVPDLRGDAEFAWPMVTSLVHAGFDLTICQRLETDHGIYSWFTIPAAVAADPGKSARLRPAAISWPGAVPLCTSGAIGVSGAASQADERCAAAAARAVPA